jgi:hypothetical protein
MLGNITICFFDFTRLAREVAVVNNGLGQRVPRFTPLGALSRLETLGPWTARLADQAVFPVVISCQVFWWRSLSPRDPLLSPSPFDGRRRLEENRNDRRTALPTLCATYQGANPLTELLFTDRRTAWQQQLKKR